MVSITLEGLLTVSDKIFDFQFFIKFHRSGPAIIFNFSNIPSMLVMHQKSPNQAKIYQDLIKMVSITLEKLWMVSDRIVNFQFFNQISRVRTCNNFQFLKYHKHVRYGSKKLLI